MIRRLILAAALAFIAAPASAQTFPNPGVNAAPSYVAPSPAPVAGIVPVITQSGTSLVAKPSAGNLYSAYAVNTSATAGFIAVINATAVPAAAAAITPQECVPIAGNATAGVNYGSGPADTYTTGIVALLSTSCTTFTAGPTGFIKARVQ